MNNKKNAGFSLVELIVVIAIMAVLVGVLAPAYLKYVEKSRKSADVSAMSDIINAANSLATDLEFEQSLKTDSTFTVDVKTGAVSLAVANLRDNADPDAAAIVKEWKSVANIEKGYDCKSKEFGKKSGTAVGTILDNGSIGWKVGTGAFFTDMKKYSKDFSSKFSA